MPMKETLGPRAKAMRSPALGWPSRLASAAWQVEGAPNTPRTMAGRSLSSTAPSQLASRNGCAATGTAAHSRRTERRRVIGGVRSQRCSGPAFYGNARAGRGGAPRGAPSVRQVGIDGDVDLVRAGAPVRSADGDGRHVVTGLGVAVARLRIVAALGAVAEVPTVGHRLAGAVDLGD